MAASSSALLQPVGQCILFIVAHPDDTEFLSGGTIARLTEEGRDVHYLIVTRGDKGTTDPEMTAERLAVVREQEQRRAAELLGVRSVTFLDGYFDSEVEPTLMLRRELALHVRKIRPETVFTFDPWRRNEVHPDHRAVGVCTLDALACARMPLNYPEQLVDGVTPHRVRDIYYFSTDSTNHWADISDAMEKKIAAIYCHESQVVNVDAADFVRRRAQVAGVDHKYRYAEAYHHFVL